MRRATTLARWFATGAVMLALAVAIKAQYRPPAPTAVGQMPPLLYLRLAGPTGMKVTLYRAGAPGAAFDAPCIIGVRPGYTYRFEIGNVAGFPGATFFPTLDVHGSLWLITKLRNADFPATIHFSEDDFAKAEDGVLLRKAVVLERPDAAVPIATRAEQPIELAVTPGRHLLQEASRHGAPLAVLHLGQRKFTPAEMADAALPGTLLLPGEKSLPAPRVAPVVPWACYPLYDPRLGTPDLAEWVQIPDGGDHDLKAGYDRGGRLKGLDPSDTVAEYVDPRGQKRIVPSNRVALCVPRFLLLRSEQALGSQIAALAPGRTQSNKLGLMVSGKQGFAEQSLPVRIEGTAGRLKPSGTVNDVGTAVTGRADGTEIAVTLRAIETLDGNCPPPTAVAPQRPLRIIKWPDCIGANVGDVVTFYLRFINEGSEPITDVVVSDSLTTRFEYVAGTQRTDRPAGFTVQPNEAGSAVLRWQFPGALAAGASGTISFQVRIR